MDDKFNKLDVVLLSEISFKYTWLNFFFTDVSIIYKTRIVKKSFVLWG